MDKAIMQHAHAPFILEIFSKRVLRMLAVNIHDVFGTNLLKYISQDPPDAVAGLRRATGGVNPSTALECFPGARAIIYCPREGGLPRATESDDR
jgi:hypothetical protein